MEETTCCLSTKDLSLSECVIYIYPRSRMNLIDNFSSYVYCKSCKIESFQSCVNWRLGRVLKQEAEERS